MATPVKLLTAPSKPFMNKRSLAIAAALGEAVIYSLNHSIAKGLMPVYIKPFGFILLRVSGAVVLFWALSLFFPKEKIRLSDWPRMLACAVFGMVINMLFFFKGLSLSTPINSSVIMTVSPILVLVLSAFLLKEKVTWLKISGIGIGLVGAVSLIVFGAETRTDAPNIPLGNFMFIINATSYGVYLILVKPLTKKYSFITLLKWFFLLSWFINLPICIHEFMEVDWQSLPVAAIWQMAYVVVGVTFFTYLFNMLALKQLAPSTLSSFVYLQPLLAIMFAVAIGADHLNAVKITAALLVFTGVYLVTKKKTTFG